MIIEVPLDPVELRKLARKIRYLDEHINKKIGEVFVELLKYGADQVRWGFTNAIYDGDRNVSVSVERYNNEYVIKASGASVLFIEFGSGITFSNKSHPVASKFGYGAGTYPSEKGHWNDPKGWWFSYYGGESGEYYHTYGNPANAVMWNTGEMLTKELKQQETLAKIRKIVEEVFNG